MDLLSCELPCIEGYVKGSCASGVLAVAGLFIIRVTFMVWVRLFTLHRLWNYQAMPLISTCSLHSGHTTVSLNFSCVSVQCPSGQVFFQ